MEVLVNSKERLLLRNEHILVSDAKVELAERRGLPVSLIELRNLSSSAVLVDSSVCPSSVRMNILLRGGLVEGWKNYILPAVLTLIFIGSAIAGAVLVVRESNANLYYMVRGEKKKERKASLLTQSRLFGGWESAFASARRVLYLF